MEFPRALKDTLLLTESVEFKGSGLHSGKPVRVVLSPSKRSDTISFIVYNDNVATIIKPNLDSVSSTVLSTEISNNNESIYTIEHLMAALVGLQVRGLTVSVYGDELPIFDGSSEFWIDALLDSDFKVSYDSLPVKAIDQPVIFREKQSVYEFLPHDKDELIIDCCYRPFEDGLYEQSYSYKHSPEAFSIEIAAAKTFCFAKDIDKLKQMGKIKGGSTENALVLEGGRALNQDSELEGTELARHKILDFVGDMGLLGFYPKGKVKLVNPNHTNNVKAFKELANLFIGRVDSGENRNNVPAKKKTRKI